MNYKVKNGFLDLSHDNIGVKGAKALARELPNTSITRLNLDRNNIGDEGVKALAEALRYTSITHLILCGSSDFDIGRRKNSFIGPGSRNHRFRKNYSISISNVLSGEYNCILDGSGRTVSEGYNDIGDEGVKALSRVLPNTLITHLNLNYNDIGDEGAKALSEALPNTSITHLYLEDNIIGAEGAKALSEILLNTSITKLDLYSNNISNVLLNQIDLLVEENKILTYRYSLFLLAKLFHRKKCGIVVIENILKNMPENIFSEEEILKISYAGTQFDATKFDLEKKLLAI